MSSVIINVSLVFAIDVDWSTISDGRVIAYVNYWIIGHNIFWWFFFCRVIIKKKLFCDFIVIAT